MSETKLSEKNVVGTSLIVSISDVGLNLIVGLITGSQSVIAQSLQGLSDLMTAIILYAGVLRSARKPDRKHPLGYGREIFFWVLLASVLMFVGTGLVTLFLGMRQILFPHVVENIPLALGMLIFGLVTNLYAFSKSWKRFGQQAGRKSIGKYFLESAIVETKATFIVDFLGTISAIFGIFALVIYSLTGIVAFDGLGAVMVGLSMMVAAIVLLLDVRALIVGKSVPANISARIRKATLTHPQVEEILELRSIYLGSKNILVLLELHLKENLNTNQIEKLIDHIQADIKKSVPHTYHCQIEVETPDHELTIP